MDSPPTATPVDRFFANTSDLCASGIKKKKLLLACTGSIATVKLPDILAALTAYSSRLSVHVILTPSSLHFLPAALVRPSPGVAIPAQYPIVERAWTNADEWVQWRQIGDPVLHIELRKWADLLVIAPLSADFLAKMVAGHVDGLLGGVVRAWDVNKTIVVAPAMNTFMWTHPITAEQLGVLRHKWHWVKVLEPVEKRLACGDVGTGAMREWKEVVAHLLEDLGLLGRVPEEGEGELVQSGE